MATKSLCGVCVISIIIIIIIIVIIIYCLFKNAFAFLCLMILLL